MRLCGPMPKDLLELKRECSKMKVGNPKAFNSAYFFVDGTSNIAYLDACDADAIREAISRVKAALHRMGDFEKVAPSIFQQFESGLT